MLIVYNHLPIALTKVALARGITLLHGIDGTHSTVALHTFSILVVVAAAVNNCTFMNVSI